MIARLIARLLHRWRHDFAPCVMVDPFGDHYAGRCCRICCAFDDDAWQLESKQ